ncbi:hypothetical protein BC828DRAFT_177666 [Blastocladiella britannica]|nr:hypothetical protein BC828DRAFT_177666 [Blastocladiella britannica]
MTGVSRHDRYLGGALERHGHGNGPAHGGNSSRRAPQTGNGSAPTSMPGSGSRIDTRARPATTAFCCTWSTTTGSLNGNRVQYIYSCICNSPTWTSTCNRVISAGCGGLRPRRALGTCPGRALSSASTACTAGSVRASRTRGSLVHRSTSSCSCRGRASRIAGSCFCCCIMTGVVGFAEEDDANGTAALAAVGEDAFFSSTPPITPVMTRNPSQYRSARVGADALALDRGYWRVAATGSFWTAARNWPNPSSAKISARALSESMADNTSGDCVNTSEGQHVSVFEFR